MKYDIDWYAALADAEWLAGSTADSAERNLARAYLELLLDSSCADCAKKAEEVADAEV